MEAHVAESLYSILLTDSDGTAIIGIGFPEIRSKDSVETLKHGEHTYSELQLAMGLSDRWLTVKLESNAKASLRRTASSMA